MSTPEVSAYPCPCCGHLTLSEPPGSHLICPVCFWQDDDVQLRWPWFSGGANDQSLIDAQHAYARLDAMDERFLHNVRPARTDERLDDGWRPVDVDRDSFEGAARPRSAWPDDLTVLYWWRPTFWRSTNPLSG